jgi:hypothetical protein
MRKKLKPSMVSNHTDDPSQLFLQFSANFSNTWSSLTNKSSEHPQSREVYIVVLTYYYCNSKDWYVPKPDWWWDRNIFLSFLVKYDHNFWPSWVGSMSALLIETLGCKVGIKKSTLWLWCLSLWIIQVNHTMILHDWGNYIGTGVRDRFTSIIFIFKIYFCTIHQHNKTI